MGGEGPDGEGGNKVSCRRHVSLSKCVCRRLSCVSPDHAQGPVIAATRRWLFISSDAQNVVVFLQINPFSNASLSSTKLKPKL